MAVTLNGTNGLTFNDGSSQATAATGFGFKNRIINGGMVISQRGTSFTSSGSNQYTLDRWFEYGAVASKFTVAQSSTAPAGYINSLLVTSSAATSVGSTDQYRIEQGVEGLNVSDLAWGTASAATVTLTFWVRSSLTGTFGGSLRNSAADRSYPFTYTINSANTWEQKTITIAGDQSGTWLTTNGIGVRVCFGLGVGSTLSGTAGAWAGANYASATGATSVVGTNGATFYITGVQLEKGSTATSFDYRPYGTELQLCQRYYSYLSRGLVGGADSATEIALGGICVVPMRASPTIALTQTTPQFISGGTLFNGVSSAITDSTINLDSYHIRINGFTGLTTGRACVARNGSVSLLLSLSAEL